VGYLVAMGLVTIWYVSKSRNKPEKAGHPEYGINELLTRIYYLLFAAIYPFAFTRLELNPYVEGQICYHIWFSLSVNIFLHSRNIWRGRRKTERTGRVADFNVWKEELRAEWKGSWAKDLERKLMHLIPIGIIYGTYFLGIALEPSIAPYEWTGLAFTYFMAVALALHMLFVMTMGDLTRLISFKHFGALGRNWFRGASRPSEYDTFTSAGPMGLSILAFILAPLPILFAVGTIGAVSDAAAALVGKTWGNSKIGHKRPSGKTIEGYIGGVVVTYLIVFFTMSWIAPATITGLEIHAMAIGASLAFLFVDIFAKKVSDNFLNTAACGIVLLTLYALFV
jgi:dolichol kinase